MTLPDGSPDSDVWADVDTPALYEQLVDIQKCITDAEGLVDNLRNKRRSAYVALYERGESYAAVARAVGQTRMAIKMQVDRHVDSRSTSKKNKT